MLASIQPSPTTPINREQFQRIPVHSEEHLVLPNLSFEGNNKRGNASHRSNRKTYPISSNSNDSRKQVSFHSMSQSTSQKGKDGRYSTLKIDTEAPSDVSGPKTSSTRSSSSGCLNKNGRRTRSDIRSPGEKKTPTAATPDFITQTDQYGNPINRPKLTGKDDDPFYPCDALMESLRVMCCCLVVEEAPIKSLKTKKKTPTKEKKMLLPMDPNDPDRVKLLPPLHPNDLGKKCLVLDLDETLVHSSFRAVPGADFVIPVQIEDVVHFVYVAKRPGVDEFLLEMAKYYEIVVYTASLNKYADPLLDLLDPHRLIRTRLFRESCVYFEGNYVKDLSLLDRDLAQSIIVDNSPNSYLFHPDNAIGCTSFIDDPADVELAQIGGFLKDVHNAKDVRGICALWKKWPDVDLSKVPREGDEETPIAENGHHQEKR